MKTAETDFFLPLGTLATLTNCNQCRRLELIGDSFALWAMTCGKSFSTWGDAWREFYAA